MTPEEYIELLQRIATRTLEEANKEILVPAGNQMVGDIINRNTREGKNTDGSDRGGYSTKPIYVGQQQFARKSSFTPRGKNGDKERKTMYFSGGYEEFRAVQGRRTDIKDYFLSGDTLNSFGLEETDTGANVGFRTERAAKIRKALEEKNGPAFYPSEQEIEKYKESVIAGTRELQIKIIQS